MARQSRGGGRACWHTHARAKKKRKKLGNALESSNVFLSQTLKTLKKQIRAKTHPMTVIAPPPSVPVRVTDIQLGVRPG